MTVSDDQFTPALRVLTVCTANVCRSPVAERLLLRHLTASGHHVVVRSAGTMGGRLGVHRDTVNAAAAIDIDLGDHVSRRLTRELVATDGRDLVITMTREHLREVVSLDPGAWPRTFTLKELARRAFEADPRTDDLAAWRTAVGDGRRAADLMRPDPDDDLDDPYGGPAKRHADMVRDVDDLTARIAHLLPPPRAGHVEN